MLPPSYPERAGLLARHPGSLLAVAAMTAAFLAPPFVGYEAAWEIASALGYAAWWMKERERKLKEREPVRPADEATTIIVPAYDTALVGTPQPRPLSRWAGRAKHGAGHQGGAASESAPVLAPLPQVCPAGHGPLCLTRPTCCCRVATERRCA